ncbi:MAG: OsmC family peroxiredoxin [Flavobacteriales bacterium]|nr:OsmC family peroxiredoxin [Flavobacteriales bacterium]
MKRHATAHWNGTGKEGNGTLTSQTGVLTSTPYNYISRFGDGAQTNPEELVAAAHAGCFSMKLAFVLEAAGAIPQNIETKCTIALDNGTVTSSHLDVKVKTDISKEKFDECIADAKANCPISKLLNTHITTSAEIVATQGVE